MTKKLYYSPAIAVLLLAILSEGANCQVITQGGVSSAAIKSQLMLLPASDGVAFLESRRLYNSILPDVLSSNPAKLAQINSELDSFKARTGIDFRLFDLIVVGMRYVQLRPGTTKAENLVLAHGNLDPAAIASAGREAARGKFHEETYKGIKISVFSINNQVTMLGPVSFKFRDLAVASVGRDMLAMGDVSRVKVMIDTALNAKRGAPSPVDGNLIELATRVPDAIAGFGSNVPPAMARNIDFGGDEVARNLSAIRLAYGSMGTTATAFQLTFTARTEKPDQAKSLGDMIDGLRQIAGFSIGGLPQARRRAAKAAIDNLKVTLAGNEVQLRIEMLKQEVADLLAPSKSEN